MFFEKEAMIHLDIQIWTLQWISSTFMILKDRIIVNTTLFHFIEHLINFIAKFSTTFDHPVFHYQCVFVFLQMSIFLTSFSACFFRITSLIVGRNVCNFQAQLIIRISVIQSKWSDFELLTCKWLLNTINLSYCRRFAKPTHYKISLKPDLETFNCSGKVEIYVTVCNYLYLHDPGTFVGFRED